MGLFVRDAPALPWQRPRRWIQSKPGGTITITGWVNNNNTDLSGYTNVNVAIYDLATRALVYTATGLTIVSGAISFSHALIVTGTTYRYLADQDGNTTDHACGRTTAL